MINPSVMGTAVAAKFAAIPQLAFAMQSPGGTGPVNITYFDDGFPISTNRDKALRALRPPGMLVLYAGSFADKFGVNDAISHRWIVWVRGRDTQPGDNSRYSDIGYYLQDGIASGDTLPVKLIQFITDCYQMDFKAYEPKSDPQGLEYWEFRFNTTEIGDV